MLPLLCHFEFVGNFPHLILILMPMDCTNFVDLPKNVLLENCCYCLSQFTSKSFTLKVDNLFCCVMWRAAAMLSEADLLYDVRGIPTNKIQTHFVDQ